MKQPEVKKSTLFLQAYRGIETISLALVSAFLFNVHRHKQAIWNLCLNKSLITISCFSSLDDQIEQFETNSETSLF